MSLEHVLLAMLGTPGSGYDLKAEFEGGARFYWSAEFGQIYPSLQTMQRKGWLVSRKEPSPKGPPRRVYRRTAKGTRELHAWLRSGPTMGTERFAWIAQLIYLGELQDLNETGRFIDELQSKQSFLRDVLRAVLSGIEDQHPRGEQSMSDVEFHEWLALQFGIRAVEARIAWCDEAREIIRKRRARGSGKKSERGEKE